MDKTVIQHFNVKTSRKPKTLCMKIFIGPEIQTKTICKQVKFSKILPSEQTPISRGNHIS